ncbi:hypothetical protein [Paenibacillus sp. MBLB4367]|uniref:hypothetical protein n=1 Tax=Paenibacillus sp. MBLB4367 TaxID=3384767 RepID=UPI003907FA44
MSEQYHVCRSYLNKRVAVYTTRGETHEGVIVNVDPQYVYLDTSPRAETASTKKMVKTKGCGCGYNGNGYNGYNGNGYNGSGFNDTITSLALFDLLAIALI